MVKLWLIVLLAYNALQGRRQIQFYMVFFLGCFAAFPVRGAMFNTFLYGEEGRVVWVGIFSNTQ